MSHFLVHSLVSHGAKLGTPKLHDVVVVVVVVVVVDVVIAVVVVVVVGWVGVGVAVFDCNSPISLYPFILIDSHIYS